MQNATESKAFFENNFQDATGFEKHVSAYKEKKQEFKMHKSTSLEKSKFAFTDDEVHELMCNINITDDPAKFWLFSYSFPGN